MQQCFAGGFALGNWSASHTFASAAGWYEPANNIPIDTPGACSDDNTVGCWLNRDCAAGATCTNPASVPSPQPGGCSNNPALRCARDADCAGLCSNFPGSVVQCLGDADCGVCANDNTRRCANANECLIAACNAPAAGTCVLGGTCTRPLPGYGRCVANPVAGAGVRCLDNSQCPANQTCSGSGAGGCSQDATKLCLNDAACQPGGTCSNPSPKVLARTIDNFTRAWRQSAKDRTDAGMLGHFNAGLLGVAGSIAPDPYALAGLPFQGEHPQYRSPDNAANGPNNTRTLQAVDQATGSKLYAILVAWGRPDPRHEVNVARVYETLVRKYNVPTQRVVLLYGNLPAGSKIGNFPARADGKPALYGGVATNAASDASITNPADAQGFFVDGPNSIENLYKAIKGDYYAANDKPAKNDRLFLYHTGHGGEVKKTLKGAKLLDTGVPAAVIADYAVWLSMPVPYYASYLLDQEEPDAMLGVDIRARQAFDLTRYPDLALTFVNGADAVFNAGRFADHPEWLEASAGADDPIPDDVPGEAAANYRLRVPPLALFDGTDDLQVPSIEFTGVDDSFFYSYHVVGVEISGGEWSEWATMPLDDQLTFTSPQTIAAGTANPGETFDLSHARLPGRLNGDFSSFASFGCRLFAGTADISSAGNPPTGWIDYWVLRIREDIDQTAGSWDEGWRQGYTRDRSMTQVCGGFP